MTRTCLGELFAELDKGPRIRATVLCSGSSGNSQLLEFGDTVILVDAGIGKRNLIEAMGALDRKPEDLSAIVVTHEHRDHVSGITWLATRLKIPVYATEGSWHGDPKSPLSAIKDRCDARMLKTGASVQVGSTSITPFPTSHDSGESCGYRFESGGRVVAIATDLGYVSDCVMEHLTGADLLVIESNHDKEMLMKGPYPWFLKKRILSERGHLSNADAGHALTRMVTPRTRDVVLAHLSTDNNEPDLAYATVADLLGLSGPPGIRPDLNLHVAARYECTGPFIVA